MRCLFNHDFNFPLGRTSAGNLKLKEDDTGLWMRCKPTDTSFSRDLKVNIDAGVVSQQSFAFRTIEDDWNKHIEEGEVVYERTLKRVQLYDVSPVTFPAYEDTTVALRSFEAKKQEFEAIAIQQLSNNKESEERETPPAETVESGSANDGGEPVEDMSEIETDLRIRETKMREALRK